MALVAPRKEFLSDILLTAIEGGINYWAWQHARSWDEDYEILNAITISPMDEDGSEGTQVTVDHAKLEEAIALIVGPQSEFEVRDDILQQIVLATRNNDAGEIDAEAADVIVQAACFGEIVYS